MTPPQQHPDGVDPLTRALFAVADRAQRHAVRKRARSLAKQRRISPPSTVAMPAAHRSPTQRRGDAGEDRALVLLQSAGCQVLARQLRCPAGELDLVVRDGQVLVFVEVRLRTGSHFGTAAESIRAAKRRRLLRAARWWLKPLARDHFGGSVPPCRFDVVTIDGAEICWHRDAMRPETD